MKQVLKSALGTVIGIIALNIVLGLFALLFIVFAAAASKGEKEQEYTGKPKSENHQVLHLQFYNISDRSSNGLEDMNIFDLESLGKRKIGLVDYLDLLAEAKTNEKIKGVYLDLNYIWSSWANLEELRNALVDFKESGKFIYAYGDVINKKAYWLASISDKIYLTPSGILEWNGISANITFYKKALEKLGIEMEVFKYGKFKSAVEPFLLEKMSDANRAQTSSLLASIYAKFLDDISSARGLMSADLDRMANELSIESGQDALDYGLIDGLKYKDEVAHEIEQLVFQKDTSVAVKFINFNKLYEQKKLKELTEGGILKKDKIALIYASGEIVMGKDKQSISVDRFAKAIKMAREDSSIKSIVLRINSPGGSALASDIIWRELVLTKGKKPIVVSMGSVAASGGYYIACIADTIVANHNTITGSIGVFGMMPYVGKFMSEKLGLTHDYVNTTEYADMGNLNRKITPFERQVIQKGVDRIYEDFVNKVGEGRSKTFDEVHAIAQGRVWSGEQGLENGLVDVVGGIQKSIEIAANMAGLTDYQMIAYPKVKEEPWQMIISSMNASIKSELMGEEVVRLQNEISKISNWVNKETYQVRLPYDIEIN